MTNLRIGYGFDVHPLKDGATLVLGGVTIPYSKGATGHSDADTLTHAICDALLGAANMGDIGVHFPDTDPALRGVNSQALLQKTVRLIAGKGFGIVNI
ncbi:MAG: 2-C-methyl-D-erythritol 2,4-cyclodiphosphate synthase, partial [Bacteroidales bacterium]|nr:2-C-methyl-D-erythritol 2,4-cyclodiphosphate synthase [Bacteroidales bacterium]